MKPYTVIGMYADNQQVWAEHVNAENPAAAAVVALCSMIDDDEDFNMEGALEKAENLFVLEIFEGHHNGLMDLPVAGETILADMPIQKKDLPKYMHINKTLDQIIEKQLKGPEEEA